jgi:predicted ATPase
LLAHAHAQGGRPAAGLENLDEALKQVEKTDGRWLEAELYRLRGELLLMAPDRQPHAAEFCFQRAIATAREQCARMWELRTATSLARLWRDQGRRAEARDLLAPVYGWFTEGFDTPDLKKACVLLDDLASAPPDWRSNAAVNDPGSDAAVDSPRVRIVPASAEEPPA